MTKRLLSAAIAVLLVLSLVPMSVFAKVGDAVKASGETKDAAVYAKVTSASEITEGKYVIYGNSVAMNNTVTSGRMGATAVTVTNDTITDPAAAIVWELRAQANGSFALYNEAANQYCQIGANASSGSNTSRFAMVASPSYYFTVTIANNAVVTMSSTATGNRFIYSYGSNFRTYASPNTSNIYLYKLQAPAGTEVTYTGETVEVTNPKVNDTFDWTFSVSEAAALSAGTWYIDYDENYLTATAFDYTWEGGLSAQIGDSLDPQSDVFMMSYNLADVVNGNTKLKCMLNLTSFDFNGINDAGKLAKITFKWNAVPTASTTLAMPIEVVNSYCGITASGVQHSPINTVPGAVNVTISSAEDVAVTYTGDKLEITDPAVNDTFDWTFSVSEAAALSAGTWYIDYDENYLTATAFDYTWEGGLSAQIGDSLDPQSDVFMMSYNLADVVNGNTKLKCMLNLTSFDFNGINDAGKLAKITFKWNAVPTESTTLAMPIEVVNSYCGITASGVQHSPINTVPGAVNVTISSAEDVAVTYTGDKLEITDPAVNDTFDWTFSVSEAAALSAGTWVIDYDENYFEATAFDYSWEGGIAAAIGEALEPTSDEFMMSSNLNDNGTVKCMLNLLSFDYNGINEGGKLAKITFKFIAVPEETTTIPMPIQAVNSYCGITSTGVQHNPINVENGEVKVIINTVEPTPEPTTEPTPEPTVEPTTPPEAPSVTITGDTTDRKGDAVGTAFFWYLNISEGSDMYAGQWLVKYDPTYLTATAASGTWNGGLATQINSTWTSGNPTSDKIAVTINKAYTGLGDGNTYLYIGLGLSPDNTHLFYGLKAGGQMARVTFKWVAIPEISVLSHDSEGYYMPLPITNVMSSYVVNDNGNYATADYPEANVTLVDGKIYIGEEPVQTYTVIFKDWDGTELKTETVEAGQAATAPADPTRTGYTFTGWDVDFSNVQSDLVVTAQYTINTYTITFVNYDGEVLQTVTADYNQTPAYTGETPVKPGDAQYTYTFTGWDPQIVPATANATYTAQFEATVNKYNIMFVNYDGTVLQQGMVAYGETPAYNGETPVKPAEGTTTYNFIGWDPQIAPVTGEATYTAQFEAVEPTGYHIYVTDYTRGRATTSIVADQLYSGEVTFTVTCDIACAVAIDNGNDSYTRLTCTTENGEHKFTVTVNADVYIVVVVRGDVNFDGNVKALDATRINQAAVGNSTLTALQILAADLNYDGIIKAMDATKAKQVAVGNQTYNW